MFGPKRRPRVSRNQPLSFPISHWNDMNIVIVESPAKAKTINKYFGSSYEVLASFVHVRDIPSKNGTVETTANIQMIWHFYSQAAGWVCGVGGVVAQRGGRALGRQRAVGRAAAGLRPRTRNREIRRARILVAGGDADDAARRCVRGAPGRRRRQEDPAARHRHRRRSRGPQEGDRSRQFYGLDRGGKTGAAKSAAALHHLRAAAGSQPQAP